MATPNATGSAALLISFFDKLFPGQAMRASTLKGLLIHTADDCGIAGPDYQYGWGLMNVKAAADLLQEYRNSPGTKRLIEDRLTTTRTAVSHSFAYAGSSPIRVTLCWTDPAASALTSAENRTARLVNNLDLQVTGPDGTSYQPYVMPYVGDWTPAKLSAPAITGKNNTDNVEQVYIATPSSTGTYTVTVTVDGTLSSGAQNFSLAISGGTEAMAIPAPSATAVTPTSGSGGTVALTITGGNFLLGSTVTLTRNGETDVAAGSIEILGNILKARLNTAGMSPGLWNVVVTNPDGQSVTLPNAFSIVGALWSDNLESGASSWSHSATTGNDGWAISTAQSYSSPNSFFAPGPSTKTDDTLVSPTIAIPSGSSNLRLNFWHRYDFQSGRDGGVLEFSLNGGTWFDVTDSSSGAVFSTGGYTSTLSNSGRTSDRNPLAGRRAWSGRNNGFTQVAIDLTDAAKYAGKNLRVRWRLATDNGTSSVGWYVDSFVLAGAVPSNLAPNIVTDAAASASIVTTTNTNLTIGATDDATEGNLTYTWTAIGDFTAPVTFSDNGTNSAKSTVATFSKAGAYSFTVQVRDHEGLTATSSVDLVVEQTITTITITPENISIGTGDQQQFEASALDQFGKPISPQPVFEWSTSGGGTVDSTGGFTAGMSPVGPFTVTAGASSVTSSASITITGQTLTAWQTAHFTPEEIANGSAALEIDFDHDGYSNLLEYALGSDPRDATGQGTITTAVQPDKEGVERLTLTFSRPKALPGLDYQVEVSSDLSIWTQISPLEITSSATTDIVLGRDSVPANTNKQRFIRMRVIRNAP